MPEQAKEVSVLVITPPERTRQQSADVQGAGV